MVICKICGYSTENHQSFNSHISHAHHIKSKEYYDTYIKTDSDGICKTCGKPTKFFNMWNGYRDFCCNSCMSSNKDIQEQRKQTSLQHYGVEFPHQSQKVKDSMAQTCLDKYGATNVYASDYGKEKIKETLLKKYGVKNIIYDYNTRSKMAKSRNKNGNQSSLEDYFEQQLIKNGVHFEKHWDKDSRYPYKCDFYIYDTDEFIEIHNYWVHNTHFFDPTNKKDLEIVRQWKNKNTSHFDNAIQIWTKIDIKKRNCAIKNNLNYTVLWNKKDIQTYLMVHFH